jgi:hypothetical protein
MKENKRKFFFRLALLIIGAIVGIFICEAIARFSYVAPWHEKLIERQNISSRLPIKKNIYGLRGNDFLEKKPNNTLRILFIGDSITFGWGIESDDKIFAGIIERNLNNNRDWKTIEKVEVLNGGISGSVPEDWIDLWNRVGRKYLPDVVIIVYFLRDGISYMSIPNFFNKIRNKIVKKNQSSWIYKHSYLFRMLKDKLDKYEISRKYTSNFVQSYLGNEKETRRWKHSQKLLLRLFSLIKDASADVGFVVFPILAELNKNYPFFAVCDHIENFVSNYQIPTLNLTQAFIGQSSSSLWVSAYDQHPNEKAHKIAAQSMLPFVENLITERLRRRADN